MIKNENILRLSRLWDVFVRWTLFAVFSSSSSSLSSSVWTEGAGLVVKGSITALAGDAVAHTGLGEPPCLSGYNYREGDLVSALSTAPVHSGDLTSLTHPARCVHRAGTYRVQPPAVVSAPAAGWSEAELSTRSALFLSGGGNHTTGEQDGQEISPSWTLRVSL